MIDNDLMKDNNLMTNKVLMKDKIINYARECINTGGVKSLSITQLVKECKISKSTFYKYFESKEELISEIKANFHTNDMNFLSVREEILQKAIEEFSKNTFENIDIESIAGAVGLKRSSIYRYFSSKEELLEVSLENEIRNRNKFYEYLKQIPFEPVVIMKKLFDYAITFYNKNYNNLMFYNALHYSKVNKNIKKILEDLWFHTVLLIEEQFQRGREEGIFRSDIDCRAMAQMTFSYIGGLGIFSFDDYNDLSDRYIQLIMNDIRIK